MTDATAPARISILDLTVDQIEALELELNLPIDRWQADYPSKAGLYRRVYVVATGATPAEAGALTLRELSAAVDVTGGADDAEGAETENP